MLLSPSIKGGGVSRPAIWEVTESKEAMVPLARWGVRLKITSHGTGYFKRGGLSIPISYRGLRQTSPTTRSVGRYISPGGQAMRSHSRTREPDRRSEPG